MADQYQNTLLEVCKRQAYKRNQKIKITFANISGDLKAGFLLRVEWMYKANVGLKQVSYHRKGMIFLKDKALSSEPTVSLGNFSRWTEDTDTQTIHRTISSYTTLYRTYKYNIKPCTNVPRHSVAFDKTSSKRVNTFQIYFVCTNSEIKLKQCERLTKSMTQTRKITVKRMEYRSVS